MRLISIFLTLFSSSMTYRKSLNLQLIFISLCWFIYLSRNEFSHISFAKGSINNVQSGSHERTVALTSALCLAWEGGDSGASSLTYTRPVDPNSRKAEKIRSLRLMYSSLRRAMLSCSKMELMRLQGGGGVLGCVVIGGGASYRLLMYDSQKRSVCDATLGAAFACDLHLVVLKNI